MKSIGFDTAMYEESDASLLFWFPQKIFSLKFPGFFLPHLILLSHD
jgi:hypothetical protein